ncbi:aminopeptidase N [Maribacter vaceletii]|uniref:Aminopeptidase N n=2 Tax=Maribacter vaceletii TaxID=1206816 RepID=A0A495E947_9FLAO|nr:aminopeptidase N [Maribacter vaceletii]
MLNLKDVTYNPQTMKLIFKVFFLFITSGLFAQIQEKVDFIRAEAVIKPIVKEKAIEGIVTYEFNALNDVSYIFLDAHDMEFTSVLLNHKKIDFLNTKSKLSIKHSFKKGKKYFITLKYKVFPKQTVYFVGWDTNSDMLNIDAQIWTQGQGKYTSYWLPSFDDMTEKVEFDINIEFDKDYTVISNGKLLEKQEKENTNLWVYSMDKPMSSYLVAFAIGNYKYVEEKSKSGIPLKLYYSPKDSLFVEPTYRYSKEIFNFLEKEIGVSYPWLNYKQIPVHDFLYAGMENTGTTIFSDSYVIDSVSFIDKNYVTINAHELAHQWFGNLITEKNGNSHWLHEGFATYYSYLAEKKLFGEEHYYWKLYDSAKAIDEAQVNEKGESLLNPKASSLTFYEKGAWALHMLREKVGDTLFKKGITSYLNKYQYKNVEVDDFIEEMELASGQKLTDFKGKWLVEKTFPFEEVKKHLTTKSEAIKVLNFIEEEVVIASSSYIHKEKIIKSYWDKTSSPELKSRIIQDYYKFLSPDFLKEALETSNLKIRRAVAKSTVKVSKELQAPFESLLSDKSYITQENALFALWSSFPEKRNQYLNATSNLIGFSNKNIRLLWLTLAIVTPEYNSLNTGIYYKELVGYTSPKFSVDTRISAFQFLNQTIGLNTASLTNLIIASNHHSWQFKKFARNLLAKLIEDEDYKQRIKLQLKELKTDNFRYIEELVSK